MKLDLKICLVCVSCLVVIHVALASRRKSPRRLRPPRPGMIVRSRHQEEEIHLITISTTTEVPINITFPYGMLCISRKAHGTVALKTTEQCCHLIGVPCKQADHYGKPLQRTCVTENRQEYRNMKACCRKKKKKWKKGHVEDGIDCNHKMENVTEPATTTLEPITITIPPTTTPTTTTTTTTTTTLPTTSKPHPKPIKHHPKTARPQHVTSKPHHHFTTTTPTTTTVMSTTTTTTTTTTTKKPKNWIRQDKKLKVLKAK